MLKNKRKIINNVTITKNRIETTIKTAREDLECEYFHLGNGIFSQIFCAKNEKVISLIKIVTKRFKIVRKLGNRRRYYAINVTLLSFFLAFLHVKKMQMETNEQKHFFCSGSI